MSMFKPVDPHPNFPKLEEEILAFWEKEKVFQKSLEKTKNGKPFVFFEGPPTANAAPGIHHVEARAFKDIIPRYQTMRGKYVLRKAGWDTHGLPVELQIEKKLGISGKKQIESLKSTVKESIAYFNKLCRESVWQFKEEWEKLTKRMGFWIDMEHPYITYENSYIEAVWGILKKIWEKKLIYQGHKVVPYCPRCGTALSSHEVAQGYETVTDNAVTVKFKIQNSKGKITVQNPKLPIYMLSWTTTPWTLPGNVALAVGKDIEYVMVKSTPTLSPPYQGGDEEGVYILAKDRMGEMGITGEIVKTLKGKDLVGLEYEPLFEVKGIKGAKGAERAFKVYPADFVNTTEGTGIVHTAVMYGEDDYELGEKVGLPKHHTVDDEGKFNDDLKAYGLAGLKVKKSPLPTPPPQGEGIREVSSPLRGEDKGRGDAEKIIIDYLKSKNLLLKEEPYTHDYPFCWRCGHYLIYYARNSWFIRMSELREQLIKNNKKINWVPEYIKEGRFGEWLREVKDWAISRERYWGTPLPFWKCESCGEIKVVGSIKELPPTPSLIKEGAKGEFDLHRPYVDDIVLKCEKCGKQAKRVPEVLDVWFDSGAMPFAQYHQTPSPRRSSAAPSPARGEGSKEITSQFPADFISEAIDQTRGWFYTLLAISTLLGKGPAYKNVICLGHVLDEKGEKMSKSKGNVVDPWKTGEKYGFDIVRWYFYTVNQPGDGKAFSEKDLQTMQRRVQLILWNVYNYFVTYANEAKFELRSQKYEPQVLDQWLSVRLQQVINTVTDNLDEYDAFHASRELDGFIKELSVWYLKLSRGRKDDAFFSTLHTALVTISKLLAPFMPFLSEQIYKGLTGDLSVHLGTWPEQKELTDEQKKLLMEAEKARGAIQEAYTIRAEEGIKLRQRVSTITVPTPVPPRFVSSVMGATNTMRIEVGPPHIDTTLTEDLRLEGLVRELERQIQEFRKESGLKIGEIVDLSFETDSDIIKKAMRQVDRKKIYVRNIEYARLLARQGISNMEGKEMEVDGEKVKFQISNVKSNPKPK